MLVRDGHGAARWQMLGEWLAWVAETKAAPVVEDPEASTLPPGDDPEAA